MDQGGVIAALGVQLSDSGHLGFHGVALRGNSILAVTHYHIEDRGHIGCSGIQIGSGCFVSLMGGSLREGGSISLAQLQIEDRSADSLAKIRFRHNLPKGANAIHLAELQTKKTPLKPVPPIEIWDVSLDGYARIELGDDPVPEVLAEQLAMLQLEGRAYIVGRNQLWCAMSDPNLPMEN